VSAPGRGPAKMSAAKDKRKSVKAAAERMEQQLVANIGPESSEQDTTKLFKVLRKASSNGDEAMESACCQAATRLSKSEAGFFRLIESERHGLLRLVAYGLTAAQHDAATTLTEIVNRAASWLWAVDPVDFTHLPQVIDLTAKFAAQEKVVALGALDAMARFARYKVAHRLAMMEGGVLRLLQNILANHRAPELCAETLAVLFLISDVPCGAATPHVIEVLPGGEGLAVTILDTLEQAPLHMRLQLAGLRVLALWSQIGEDEVQKALIDAGAKTALQRARDNLAKGGFSHADAWFSAVATKVHCGRGGNSWLPASDGNRALF